VRAEAEEVPGSAATGLRFAASAAAGAVFGLVMAALPAPRDPSAFWAGNLFAPWLALAFLAGVAARGSWRAAALAGVVADAAAVLGFYLRLVVVNLADGDPANNAALLVLLAPWLAAALVAGVGYGTLGRWWRRARPPAAGVAAGLPFVAEPWVWRAHLGYLPAAPVLWAVETAVGVAAIAVLAAARRRAPAACAGRAASHTQATK
jgi:hypothetical protein